MNAATFRLGGILPAQWTPIDASGRLDRTALAAHIAFERRQGVAGIFALGSTGEFPRFTAAEREEILATMAELAAPLPMVANISDLQLPVTIALGRFAHKLGLQAVGLMPPSFYPVTQADMLEYFLRVAEAVELPVMLYNFPELTGNRIGLETIAAFADRARMIGIKQSGGEFDYHRELIPLGQAKGFAVMSGADTRLDETFRLGAAGCIGGLVNLVPDLMVGINRALRAAEPHPDTLLARVAEVGRTLDRLTFPLNVAAGMKARGLNPGSAKMPVSRDSWNGFDGIVRDLSAKFAEWGLAPIGDA